MKYDDYVLNTSALLEALQQVGWTPAEFSRRSGISESMVSRLLDGQRNVGRKTIIGLMRCFPDIPLNQFLSAPEEDSHVTV
jgi:transcriptional regulator with XRE-family HTH domain